MTKLPLSLKTEEDLQKAYTFFYAKEQQRTDLKHLRFGQFLFNCYNIEFKNSYNEKDPKRVLYLINEILNHISSYEYVNKLIEEDSIKLPQELRELL